jgi:putative Ca2+/H+ antiporter (TMEM165/GDT1 family)
MLGFIVPFATIALAELGDKTQISLLVLSSGRRGNRRALLAGAMAAFLLVDGAAVAFGAIAVEVVPMRWVKTASGILFILFGILSLRTESDDDEKKPSGAASMSPFAAAFAAVSILEWGDKTQVAAALFAAKFHPAAVLAGTLAALGILSAIAIWLGDAVASKINKKIVSRAAAAIFIIMGFAAFFF